MSNTNKNKNLGATPTIKPSFTADRFFIYVVGAAVGGAGLYVIYRFVKAGLDRLEGNNPNQASIPNKETKSGGGSGSLAIAGEGRIPPPSAFPLRAIDLNRPPYDKYTQWLQEMMIEGEGGQSRILPVFGADGKWGYETQKAVETVFRSNKVTQSAYLEYYNRRILGANPSFNMRAIDEMQMNDSELKGIGELYFGNENSFISELGCLCQK